MQAGLLRQQHLHLAMKKVAHRGIVRAEALRVQAPAVSKKPGWQHPGVVQNEEVVGLKQVSEPAEGGISKGAGSAIEVQHARRGAIRKRLLRDQLLGKVKIEFRNQHCSIIGGSLALLVGELPKGGVVLQNCPLPPRIF